MVVEELVLLLVLTFLSVGLFDSFEVVMEALVVEVEVEAPNWLLLEVIVVEVLQ